MFPETVYHLFGQYA